MGYHPRIETKRIATFQTTRTERSELWFVNNAELDHAILGYAAKYSQRYSVKLYGLAMPGNHIHCPALFEQGNRANFMRDLNSSVARAVPRYQKNHPGGRVFGRRYSAEFLPGHQDIEDKFFYTVLQPVQDGGVDDISDFKGYNCFEDAVRGITRSYPVVRWKEYNDARRWNRKVSIEEYTEMVELTYARLPGYESLSQAEYESVMRKKLKERTEALLRDPERKPAAGAEALAAVVPGSRPKTTKTSGRYDHRPRVLSIDPERRAQLLAWYFAVYSKYKEASAAYRKGDVNVRFPKGTYKPPVFTVVHDDKILPLLK